MQLDKLLEQLCAIDGISGDEKRVSDFICSYLDGKCDYRVDRLGNVIAFKKGRRKAAHRVMVSAHMDEVGLIVTYINSDGTLRFSTVGGIDPAVLYGKRVYVGKNRLLGVIAGKAIHNLSQEEREKLPQTEDMVIDIGMSEDEAKRNVRLGDSVTFDGEFLCFGDDMLKSKAIDDRAGCAIMLALIDGEMEYDTFFTFVVQEEVGLRGSGAAAYQVKPELALVLEATTAADIPSSKNDKRVCEVGKGAVVSYMDRHTIYDKELYSLAFETAAENDLPCQTKTAVAGGNDAGAISVSRDGVRTLAISLPCRYLHSPACVISKRDLLSTFTLTQKFLERISSL
ncbi:MAG: M42 family metallopeptidase [Ruminococcus sp.]|nr:M42 family metallopeptidase [Ruminococcus sp.]